MTNGDIRQNLKTIQWWSAIVGLAGVVICAGGYWLSPLEFFQSYLLALLYWSGISLGCTVFLMLHHLAGGAWGVAICRILEAGSWPLVVMPLLFAPMLAPVLAPQQLAGGHLYPWTDPSLVEVDKILQHKAPWFALPWFTARSAGYLLAWAALAGLLSRWSLQQDALSGDYLATRLRRLSAGGLVLYGLTATFASFDWVMSIDAHWFSSIYGVITMAGQAVAGLAFAIVMLVRLSPAPPLATQVRPTHYHDLGNLLLASIAVWAYVSFAQYLIIWSGNLPDEIPWYQRRAEQGWLAVTVALALLHFVVPFVLLLIRDVKRNTRQLAMVAGLLLAMHLVDVFWRAIPEFRSTPSVHWLDVLTLVTVGAIWLAIVLGRLQVGELLPRHEVKLLEETHHG